MGKKEIEATMGGEIADAVEDGAAMAVSGYTGPDPAEGGGAPERARPPRDRVYGAIAAATGQIERVGHDGNNEHHKFPYASIDQVMAYAQKALSENGLAVEMELMNTETFAKPDKPDKKLLLTEYRCRMGHESGQATKWVRRDVVVDFAPPHCYGAAESYVWKRYVRFALCIPTGDGDDPDAQAKHSDAGDLPKKTPSKAMVDGAIKALDAAESLDDLRDRFTKLSPELRSDKRVKDHSVKLADGFKAAAGESEAPPAEGKAKPPSATQVKTAVKQIEACNTASEVQSAVEGMAAPLAAAAAVQQAAEDRCKAIAQADAEAAQAEQEPDDSAQAPAEEDAAPPSQEEPW